MSSEKIQKLITLFSKLPGIGPRQAGRLAFHLLDEKNEYKDELGRHIASLKDVRRCASCFQAFEGNAPACVLCSGQSREKAKIMLVEKDMDFMNIEQTRLYNGLYFILGGVLSPLHPQSQERLRMKELFGRIKSDNALTEVIIATSATPEGDHTARYVEKILEPIYKERKNLTLTHLARGLSTGSELEYSDSETFKNAYLNRK